MTILSSSIDLSSAEFANNAQRMRALIEELRQRLPAYGLGGTQLLFRQDTTDIKREILSEIRLAQGTADQKDQLIAQLQDRLGRNRFDQPQLLGELQSFFPEITAVSVSNHEFSDGKTQELVALYQSEKPLGDKREAQVAAWLGKRLKRDKVVVYRQKTESK